MGEVMLDWNVVANIVAVVLGLVSLITTLVWLGGRVAKMELKVDTMWTFQLNRGFGEALNSGLVVRNSPARITDRAKELFAFLDVPLKEFFAKFGYRMTDIELSLAIERLFGAEITEKICIPNRLQDASCLVIAMAIAKGNDVIESPDDSGHDAAMIVHFQEPEKLPGNFPGERGE